MTSYFSSDRPRFYCVAVSGFSGQVFILDDVEQFQTSKADDGSAGTFSVTMPLRTAYDPASLGGIDAYAQVASFMDLIAIYATRQVVADFGAEVGNPPLKPPSTEFYSNVLNYGDANAATVKALGTPDCIMVGMSDSVDIEFTAGEAASMQITGRDLTKIFEVNDAGLPDAASLMGGGVHAAKLGIDTTPSTTLGFELASLSINQKNSGPTFILAILDLLVGKDVTVAGKLSTSSWGTTPALVKAYAQFGYPWRSFIRTDDPVRFNLAYQPIGPQNMPSYQPQAGPIWASILELRNPPVNRIFVDELGSLVFDSSWDAWFKYDADVAIPEAEIRSLRISYDDEDFVTFLSVLPVTAQLEAIAQVQGQIVQGAGFVNGLQRAKTVGESHVQLFGYRYAQFQSMYVWDIKDLAALWPVLMQVHNNCFTASLVVRGRPCYRVGHRYRVLWNTPNPLTSNALWYATKVSHSGIFGSDYTTTLELRFPQAGQLSAGAVGASAPGATGGGV